VNQTCVSTFQLFF